MRKVKPELAIRRQKKARKDRQRIKENGRPNQRQAEPRREPYTATFANSLLRRQTVPGSTLPDESMETGNQTLIEEPRVISLSRPSPEHILDEAHTVVVKQLSPKKTTFYRTFHQHWRHLCVVGEGGDGVVHQFQQRKCKNEHIAMKVPHSPAGCEDLEHEIANMRRIGSHEHILQLLVASPDWIPYGPALILPYCDLGDLTAYRKSWCAHQVQTGQPERVSEITMCKLFRDVALALDHLHNNLDTRYVHNDLKPQNILAFTPNGYTEYGTLPEEPIFKLADFARLTPWPTPFGRPPIGFDGTYEFAPPAHERVAPVLPSADIWSLGATLQYMAFGIAPIQSREAFVWSRKGTGKPYPDLHDEYIWGLEYWRKRIPTVFRPINLPTPILLEFYDLPYDIPDYQPFSARLGYWYAQLYKPVGSRHKGRPTASRLVREAVPHMEGQIEYLKTKRTKETLHELAILTGRLDWIELA